MSTNISKEKREQLIAKISEIKAFIEKSADDKNKSNLLSYMGDLQKELINKHYGLIFEEHRERIDEILSENLPVLTEEKDLFIDNGGQQNFLIEGDNLASLQLLEKTHRGKIDLIYIDPPYNTGNKDFIYDDNYVAEDDTFRHSKWCSFMEKRLKKARRLLKNDGIIFISINEIEQAQLKILCDSLFGEENLLSVHYIQSRYADKDVANNGADWLPIIEYVFIYSKDINEFKLNKPTEDYDLSPYHFRVEELGSGEIIDMKGKKVEVFKKGSYKIINEEKFDVNSLKEVWASGSLLKQKNTAAWYYNEYLLPRLENDGIDCLYKIYGIGEDGLGFRYVKGPAKFDKLRGKVYQGVPFDKKVSIEKGTGAKKNKPVINYYDFSADFGNIINEGNVGFNSGKKPVKMLKQFINYHKNKNITVLDYFAGSASTGHAVVELNHDDNGNRKYILCTSSEKDICRKIAYERLKNVLQKYPDSSLKYFRVEYIPITDRVYYDYADQLLEHTKELVELENAVNFTGNAQLAIILSEDELDSFCADKEKISRCKKIYLGHECATTAEQDELFVKQQISVIRIPNYYYKED